MRKIITYSSMFIILVFGFTMYIINNGENPSKYNPRQQSNYGMPNGADMYNKMRININTGKIESSDYHNLISNLENRLELKTSTLKLYDEGPNNVGGRTRALLIDRNNVDIIYAGSVSGGLFKSTNGGNTWTRLNFTGSSSISALGQSKDGTIYIGTGTTWESSTTGTGQLSIGAKGDGVYYSQDGGNSFTKMIGGGLGTKNITRIIADPSANDKIYVCGEDVGVKIFENKTFVQSATGLGSTDITDLDIAPDGSFLLACNNSKLFKSTDFSSFSALTAVPSSGNARIEMAISPLKNNMNKYSCFAIAVKSNGSSNGIYSSMDNGDSWLNVVPATNTNDASSVYGIDPFATSQFQGDYDCAIVGDISNPNQFYIAGIDVYKFKVSSANPPYGNLEQLSIWSTFPTFPIYSHADHHIMTWAGNNLYLGSDGGVEKYDGSKFVGLNRGYNVTQFYDVAYTTTPEIVMGGAQDNGCQIKVPNLLPDAYEFTEISGGDGFDVEISNMINGIAITTSYFGSVRAIKLNTPISQFNVGGQFNTKLALYENEIDQNSKDSITFTATQNYTAGTIIKVNSMNGIEFNYTLPTNLNIGNSIKIKDIVQAIAAFSAESGTVRVSRDIYTEGLNTYNSFSINGISSDGGITDLEFSKDGDALYVSTFKNIYRVTGFNNFYRNSDVNTLTTTIIYSNNGLLISGMDVDPNDPNHIVIVSGGYGISNHILECNNSLSTNPTFSNISGDLPDMPVFDVVIDNQDANKIIIGTEIGVWMSTNGGSNWSEQNDDIGRVPIFSVKQQWRTGTNILNSGYIYFATHGRGAWSTNSSIGIDDENINKYANFDIDIYPNPSTDKINVKIDKNIDSEIELRLFDINGRLTDYRRITKNNIKELEEFYINNYNTGIYFINMKSFDNKINITKKFIKQ